MLSPQSQEVHDEDEANLALESGARVIGVNNRDLRDFTVDLGTFERLAPRLAGATLVAESGVKSPEDARRLRGAGADAVLVGPHFQGFSSAREAPS